MLLKPWPSQACSLQFLGRPCWTTSASASPLCRGLCPEPGLLLTRWDAWSGWHVWVEAAASLGCMTPGRQLVERPTCSLASQPQGRWHERRHKHDRGGLEPFCRVSQDAGLGSVIGCILATLPSLPMPHSEHECIVDRNASCLMPSHMQ